MIGKGAAGFTYIGLLIAIAVIGGGLAAVGQVWSLESRREKEAELLYRGDSIRKAIAAYVHGPGGSGQFPQELQDMVKDQRTPQVTRYLRRVYEDPLTGMADWNLIRAPDGGIMGVASSSQAKPLKVQGFNGPDEAFKDATCYCDWQFIYVPQRRKSPSPASNGQAAPALRQ